MAIYSDGVNLRGSSAEWAADNRVLANGQTGIADDLDLWKTGDGVKTWTELSFRRPPTVRPMQTWSMLLRNTTNPEDFDHVRLDESAGNFDIESQTPLPEGWTIEGTYLTFPAGVYSVAVYWETQSGAELPGAAPYLDLWNPTPGASGYYPLPIVTATGIDAYWGGGSYVGPFHPYDVNDPRGWLRLYWSPGAAPVDVGYALIQISVTKLGDINFG